MTRVVVALAIAGTAALLADTVYEPLRGHDPELVLGVGHLQPEREEDRYDWLDRLVLPLYDAPGGRRIEPPAQRMAHALETGYETVSFIVLVARADGWLDLGFGWVQLPELAAATPPLAYEPWERLFASGNISPLYFRARVRHALRTAASPSAPLVTWIPADPDRYAIEPLSFAGDWARVRVAIPSSYCTGPGAPAPVLREGWVRWRDPERSPWLWYYTRGC